MFGVLLGKQLFSPFQLVVSLYFIRARFNSQHLPHNIPSTSTFRNKLPHFHPGAWSILWLRLEVAAWYIMSLLSTTSNAPFCCCSSRARVILVVRPGSASSGWSAERAAALIVGFQLYPSNNFFCSFSTGWACLVQLPINGNGLELHF